MRTYEELKSIVKKSVGGYGDYFYVDIVESDITSEELCIVIEIINTYIPKITQLNLYHNELTYIPECIILLKYLRELYLSHNEITIIPKCVGDLQYLQILSLSENQINYIEDEGIMRCQNLEILDLGFNEELRNIDMRIFELPILRKMIIIDTKVSKKKLAKYMITSSLITTKIYFN